ncbi:MAG: N-acetylneuraminate synthase family protein [Alphaproteobacteria bacterium]|nr:N-acetylneuraminate synthase family protein [Alphaproteobacteria bacterium]
MLPTSDGHTYVIAEIGANHNGDMKLARQSIDAAHAAGADAAKFQSWDTGLFARGFYNDNPGLEAQVAEYAVAAREMSGLADYCREVGIDFASTPFSRRELRELDALDPPFIKIASMDLNNDHLLAAAAETGRTIVLSTGFARTGEIEHALSTLEGEGHTDTVLLHCIGLYPPPTDQHVNLRNMEMLAETFGYPVGFSDHTKGVEVTLAAIALGAAVIEKHFTLDKNMDGWDHAVSADPADLAVITSAARRIPAALGSRRRVVSEEEARQGVTMRRSIVAARDLPAGHVLTLDDLEFRRPGTGISPNDADRVVGRELARAYGTDELLCEEDLLPARAPALAVSDAA